MFVNCHIFFVEIDLIFIQSLSKLFGFLNFEKSPGLLKGSRLARVHEAIGQFNLKLL